jgi:CRISPR-associated protein Csd1
MILHALHDLYQRRMADADPKKRLPAYGFEDKPIPYIIEITLDGELVGIRPTWNEAKKPVAKMQLVPQGVKKTSGVAANLLWDTFEYVLGVDTKGKPERVREQHAAFRARIHALPASAQADPGIVAINRFLDQFSAESAARLPEWPKLLETNPNMSFQLHKEDYLICQRPEVSAVCQPDPESDDASAQALCLITGETGPLERLHSSIKGVWGAQSSGANIVSFNADAYLSYGKEQGENAPVSKRAAFAYTTALNALLQKESGQRVQVGDSSTVFWAAKDSEFETAIPDAFGEFPKDEWDRGVNAVKKLYNWVHDGKAVALEGDTRFFVLGLAPNAARIAIRFWATLPLRELAPRMVQHFEDLKIVQPPFAPEYPSLFRLLTACAVQGKADNILPNLGGEIMRAVLAGTPYPATLFNAAIRRCHAEQEVGYLRAAIIKAWINRQTRLHSSFASPSASPGKEICVMLDPQNQTTGYLLGRLFAVLERLQEKAANPEDLPNTKLNATIRDRYFGAAATSPLMVFTTLMKLQVHHVSKLKKFSSKTHGAAVFYENLIGEIIAPFKGTFPNQMALDEQGLFFIGYYHQRQDFFISKSTAPAAITATAEKDNP